MDREIANDFLNYVEALFELEFKPLYDASVYCDCGHFDKISGWDYHLRCCICTDKDGERDEDKDWIIEFNLDFDNAIKVNTKHPDYDEDMEEHLDDFIEEILKFHS